MLSQLWSTFGKKLVGKSVLAMEQPEMGKSGIAFAVDSVTPAGKPIRTESLEDSLARRFRRKILVLPEQQQPVINTSFDVLDSLKDRLPPGLDLSNFGSRYHPLVDAVHVAFSGHRPLTLSPDSIWLVIAQGFGHHVAENAEVLRHRLVSHQGRRGLSAEVEDLSLASFERTIANFSLQILKL